MQRLWEIERRRRRGRAPRRDPRPARRQQPDRRRPPRARPRGAGAGAAGHRLSAVQPPRDAVRSQDRAAGGRPRRVRRRRRDRGRRRSSARCRTIASCGGTTAAASRSSTTSSRGRCSPGASGTSASAPSSVRARRPAGGTGAAACSPSVLCSPASSSAPRRSGRASSAEPRVTEARRATARALEARAATTLADDPELSLLLAAEAARLVPGTAAEDALRRALLASRLRAVVRSSGPLVRGRAGAGRGLLVTGGDAGRALVARMRDGAVVGSFDQHAPITALAVSATGDLALTGGRDGTAVLWRVPDGRPSHELDGRAQGDHQGRVRAGGRLVLVASADGAVRTYDVASGSSSRRCSTRGACATPLSPPTDGSLRRPSRTRGSGSGTPARANASGRSIREASPSPSRSIRPAATSPRRGRITRFGSGTPARGASCSRTSAPAGSFRSRSGRAAARRGRANRRRGNIWTARDGSLVGRVEHANAITDVEFDATGIRLATASSDQTARIWAAKDGRPLGRSRGTRHRHDGPILERRPRSRHRVDGRDGTRVGRRSPPPASPDEDSRPHRTLARRHEPGRPHDGDGSGAHGRPHRPLRAPRPPAASSRCHIGGVQPRRAQLVTGSLDHDSFVFDARTGALLHSCGSTAAPSRMRASAPTAVGSLPQARGGGPLVSVLGQVIELLKGPTSLLTAAAFTADSRAIVTREQNGDVRRAECASAETSTNCSRSLARASTRQSACSPTPSAASTSASRCRGLAAGEREDRVSSSCRVCRSPGRRRRTRLTEHPGVEIMGEDEAVPSGTSPRVVLACPDREVSVVEARWPGSSTARRWWSAIHATP